MYMNKDVSRSIQYNIRSKSKNIFTKEDCFLFLCPIGTIFVFVGS